ncbi:MAG: ImmA/IrrE family metallo-endopeptidase [Acidobacteriota bacterium]|nr:ImmA/IrrE family metallo-endopeptidase [Acidobacteriota bacterium]
MRDKKIDHAEVPTEQEKLIEALLGADDELEDEARVDESLAALGISPSDLISEFADYLEKEARRLEGEGRAEGSPVRAALRGVHARVKPAKHVGHALSLPSVRSPGTPSKSRYWTNASVLELAAGREPVETIAEEARKAVLEFTESGGSVPPLDPFALAEFRGIKVIPRDDVRDARTKHLGGGKFIIEFNPNRPRGRVRYSLCHEITHTLFPDCGAKVRNRATHEEMVEDEWQLEMLCNVGAGELLMPFGTLPEFNEQMLSIEKLMQLRKDYDVSTEALLLRVARVATSQCCVFSASHRRAGPDYQIDYVRPSKFWQVPIPNGFKLPKTSVVRHCTAIGYTETGVEQWSTAIGDIRVECVGIPPYPNQIYPRVMGVIIPTSPSRYIPNKINYKRGDATDPRDDGDYRIIAHIVNDKTAVWGGVFARAVKKRWPQAQTDFERWSAEEKRNLSLGNARLVKVDERLAVFTMVAQRGYGESNKPRIKYSALKSCLEALANVAMRHGASIHMPRIGSGQAGGNWDVISELIEDALCGRGIKVYVYTLPNAPTRKDPQGRLAFPKDEDQEGRQLNLI